MLSWIAGVISGILKPSLSILGRHGAHLGCIGAIMRLLGAILGRLGAILWRLGPSLSSLGSLRKPFQKIERTSGSKKFEFESCSYVLEASWEPLRSVFGTIWGRLGYIIPFAGLTRPSNSLRQS